jgi:hypothetical protein
VLTIALQCDGMLPRLKGEPGKSIASEIKDVDVGFLENDSSEEINCRTTGDPRSQM